MRARFDALESWRGIAANYERRLREGFGVWRFALLRFGRLYPLHVATLGMCILLHLAAAVADIRVARGAFALVRVLIRFTSCIYVGMPNYLSALQRLAELGLKSPGFSP